MRVAAYLRSLRAKFFQSSRVEDEMEAELRSHIDMRADDLERSGLDRAEAERRARIEFGGHGRFKEECREALGGNVLETLLHDVRFGVRVLRKSPGFTAVAILTLTLGISANAVVFGVLNSLVLRPLNVPEPESLWGIEDGKGSGFQSYPNYRDLRERNRSFEDLAAIRMGFVALDTGKEVTRITGWETSGNYFDVLRIRPYLGRFFHSSDEHGPDSAPYVVLSYAFWHSHFQDDQGVVGRTIRLNKHPLTIIGVAPPEFRGTLLFFPPDFFMPIVNQAQVDGEDFLHTRAISNRGVFEVLGHLKAGVTPAQAISDLKSIGAYLERTYPKEAGYAGFSLGRPGLYVFGRDAEAFLAGLMLLAGLILVAACANLGSLFAARAVDRSREIALRLALGSSRNRILRGLFTEAGLISFAGGALGLAGSIALLHGLGRWQPFPGNAITLPVSPDAKLYVVALLLVIMSALLFGMVPVRQVLRTDPYEIVKAAARVAGGRRLTVRELLVAGQIAMCAVLVTSSIVAVRGLMRSLDNNFGFEPLNAMVAGTNLTMAGYHGDGVLAMQRRMLDAVATIPGVRRVGLVNNYPPLVNAAGNRDNVFRAETEDLRAQNAAVKPYRYEVSPGYFDAAGTALLAGREFTWHDDQNAPAVAVVNREFARKMFGSVANTTGRSYKLQDGTRVQVVGVVEDGKYLSLTEEQQPAMFLPFLKSPASLSSLVVRASNVSRNPQQLAAAIREKVGELDRGLPVDTETWTGMLGVVLFPAHMATLSLGVLGGMGALLSMTGIFGMAAYSVSKRMRELGIRIALGAQRRQVLKAALGRSVRLLAFGSVMGLALGILASRVLASIVYEATPRDPLVLAGAIVAMLLLGLVATWIPAQRALSLNPVTLLREE